jgi:hypothetical protein
MSSVREGSVNVNLKGEVNNNRTRLVVYRQDLDKKVHEMVIFISVALSKSQIYLFIYIVLHGVLKLHIKHRHPCLHRFIIPIPLNILPGQ